MYSEDHWKQSMRELKDAITTALPHQKKSNQSFHSSANKKPVSTPSMATPAHPARSHILDVGFGSPSRGQRGQAALLYIESLKERMKALEHSRNSVHQEYENAQNSLRIEQEKSQVLEKEAALYARRQEELAAQLNEERARTSKLQEELNVISSSVVQAAAEDVAAIDVPDSSRMMDHMYQSTASNNNNYFSTSADQANSIRAEMEAEKKVRNVHAFAPGMSPSKRELHKVQHDLDEAFDSVKRNMFTLSQQADIAKARSDAAKHALNDSVVREEEEYRRKKEAERESLRAQQEEARRDTVELVSTLDHVKQQMMDLEKQFADVKQQEELALAGQTEALHQERMKNSYLEMQNQTAENKLAQLEQTQMMSEARLREIEGGIDQEKKLRKSLEENRRKVDETLMRSVVALNESMMGNKPRPSAPPVDAEPKWIEAGKKGNKARGKTVRKGKKKVVKNAKKTQHKQPPFVPSSHSGLSHNLPANVQKVLAVLHQHNAENCDTCRRAASKVVEENQEKAAAKTYSNDPVDTLYSSVRREMDELNAQYQDLTSQSLDQTLDPADSQLIADGLDSLSDHIKSKREQLEIVKKLHLKMHKRHSPVRPVATTPSEARIDAFHLMKHLAFSHDDDRHRLESPSK